ncbi:uncharacterized protein A4U43_C05F15500 [Asparagus officinalis]|uniref:Uncharacterized protein n=1 Tax=Asparagus officinalis TaxID=4686 RepID=A0A5P1ESG6_ASPOF|nr:trichohyalin [Asparagus officinalis]ONK68744.1 uncharacterized protein A4U43_C05F15500 [Asparagus officinalis]
MTEKAGECNGRSEGSKVEFESKRGRDLKENGVGRRDAEEIGGSFVIVNGDSDDHSDRDLDLDDKLDPKLKLENERICETRVKNGEKLSGNNVEDEERNVNGSESEIEVEERKESEGEEKLDSDAQLEQKEVEVDSVKEENLEEERTEGDKDLGVEGQADVAIDGSDSKVELGSEVEKEPETVEIENGHLDELQSASPMEEEKESFDVGEINVGEGQKTVDVVGENDDEPNKAVHTVVEVTENSAELGSTVELEPKQETNAGVEETEKLEKLGSCVDEEPTTEPKVVVEERDKSEVEEGKELEVVVEENNNQVEIRSAVDVESMPELDAVVEERDKAEIEEKDKVEVGAQEHSNQAETGSAVEVEPEQESKTVQEEAYKIETKEKKKSEDVNAAHTSSKPLPLENGVAEVQNADSNAPTNEPSGQLTEEINQDSSLRNHVSEKEPLEKVSYCTDDKHEELKVGNIDTVTSEPKTEISGKEIEPRSSDPATVVDSETEAEELCLSENTEAEKMDSIGGVEINKYVAVNGLKLESESRNESVKGSECVVSFTEGDRSTNKDDDEEPNHEQTQAAETIQAPPESHVVKRHRVYMIKVPRFIDDELQKKIQDAMKIVDEKTKIRDEKGDLTRNQAAIVHQKSLDYKAALAKEMFKRAIFKAKRNEVEKEQEAISRINNANSIADIDEKIRNMAHRQQHETISLKQEKQYIHDINQMKRLREQLSSKAAPQEQIDEALNQKEEVEGRFKNLKKELDTQRAALLEAESCTKFAWNKYTDEDQILKSLKEEYNAADGARQEAYLELRKLRNQSTEKFKHFKMFKSDELTAKNYIFSGDNQGLLFHCSKQVERIMDLWNNDKEFREQYVKSNIYSTLRRLGTPDGRSLGPGEDAPVIQSHVARSSNTSTVPSSKREIRAPVLMSEVREENLTGPSETKQASRTNQSAKSKSSAKPSLAEGSKLKVSNIEESKEAEKLMKLKKEEEELTRKAEELARKEEELRKEKAAKEEELRKEKAAAELKEKLRLEQKAKAREAEERKRRKAEKAQAKAEYRARKESELKEKKKTKKENKKSGTTDTSNEREITPIVDTNPPETSQESESSHCAAQRRKAPKPASSMRQYNKVQPPVPLPLRNRGKRKMTTWMWALLVVLLVLVLFFAGNYITFSTSGLPNFNF